MLGCIWEKTAVIHLTRGRCEAQVGSGTLDHFAFRASDPGNFIDNLKEKNVDFEERRVPDQQQHQVFIKDPDGITIEVVFETISDLSNLIHR